jgi:hypothetical protein
MSNVPYQLYLHLLDTVAQLVRGMLPLVGQTLQCHKAEAYGKCAKEFDIEKCCSRNNTPRTRASHAFRNHHKSKTTVRYASVNRSIRWIVHFFS